MHSLQGAPTSRTVYRSFLQHRPLIQLPVPPSRAAAGRRSLSTLVKIKSWGRVPVAMSTAANVPADGSSPSSPAGPSVTGNLKTRDDWEDDARENARREKRWNRLADGMKRFHDYFKSEFNAVYEMADGSFNKRGLSIRMYLAEAGDMSKHLTMHHTIEERHIFPILAKRMPTFKDDEVHIKSHHGIHEGLDKLGALLAKWNAQPSTYSPQEMKDCLDSWREVLFVHLDQEVEDLSGENMKKYWTLQELERIPM